MIRSRTSKRTTAALIGALWLLAAASAAAAQERTVSLPVRLDNAYLQQALVDQAFKDPGPSARVWDDQTGCNYMTITNPRVATHTANGRTIQVTTDSEARIGQRLGDQCVVLLDWAGSIATTQQVMLESNGTVLGFRIVDSEIKDEQIRQGLRLGTLWEWVKEYVHPRLASVRIDLAPALNDLSSVLELVLPARRDAVAGTLDSIALQSVEIVEGGVIANLVIRLPDEYYRSSGDPEPALSAAELARFESTWQGWDSFVTFIVKHVATGDASAEVRRDLLDVLIQARYDLVEVLAADTRGPDPVRSLFVETWSRLAPILRRISPEQPGGRALNLLSFIAAADALQTLDALGPQFNLDISVAGLRRLARILVPDMEKEALRYDQRVDPDLRELFEFGPPPRLRNDAMPPSQGWWRGLIPAARADGAPVEAEIARLNSWIPGPREVDDYLSLVHELLDGTSRKVAAGSDLDPELHEFYRVLVLATAWQETCWRQYRRAGDEIVPMRSPAGAVGLMQVVPTVWRGFYEPGGLTEDIAYNAAAGSEILMHYLVNYAIARGEDQRPGGRDNLAWATYAAYNGGPRHLHRYRSANRNDNLRNIDLAFRDKFRTIREGDELAVRGCYSD